MIIVLKQDAPDAQVREFCHELQDMGLQINDSKGSDTHILGLIGDTKAIAESWVLANPVVETCRRVSEPYKKANRKFHPDDSVIDVNGVKIGGGNFAVIAGPCSIESEEQITYCAQRVKDAGASLLRGGAFKPRTSPYSFQGMRSEGLDLLKLARRATGSPIVTEIINAEHPRACAASRWWRSLDMEHSPLNNIPLQYNTTGRGFVAPPCRKCAPDAKKETKNPKSEIKRFQEKTGDFERFKNLR